MEAWVHLFLIFCSASFVLKGFRGTASNPEEAASLVPSVSAAYLLSSLLRRPLLLNKIQTTVSESRLEGNSYKKKKRISPIARGKITLS